MPEPASSSSSAQEMTQTGYSREELELFVDEDRIAEIDPSTLADTSAYTVSLILGRMDDVDDVRTILRMLDEEKASSILSEMDAEDAADIVSAMREMRAIKILEGLDPDDAADVVGELEDDHRDRLLAGIDPETAETVRGLIQFESDTAGGIMTPEVATVRKNMLVTEATEHVRVLNDELENIHYIYVVNERNQLEGVVSIRELVFAKSYRTVGDIMKSDLRGICPVDMDQEDVARLMQEHNYVALPVVDENGVLLGIVTHDDVMDILRDEATEDIQKMVGVAGNDSVYSTISESVRGRSPWLCVNLLTALAAGGVVMHFSDSIAAIPLLAAFMPVVASLGGNTGGQTLAIVIRGIAVDGLEFKDSTWVSLREGLKALLNSLLIGALASAAVGFYTGDWHISAVIYLAMVLTMSYSGIAGATIPLMLKKLNLDPAQSSSIFVTATTDIVGFGIFLGLAATLLL